MLVPRKKKLRRAAGGAFDLNMQRLFTLAEDEVVPTRQVRDTIMAEIIRRTMRDDGSLSRLLDFLTMFGSAKAFERINRIQLRIGQFGFAWVQSASPKNRLSPFSGHREYPEA